MSSQTLGKALLSVQNITRSYGSQPILDNVSLTIHEGERVGFIGRNGSGKSTLMRILAGMDTPDTGIVSRAQGLRVSLLGQECPLPREWTVARALEEATREKREMLEEYHRLLERLGALDDDAPEHTRLKHTADELHHALDLADAWDLTHELKRISTSLALADPERTLGSLSGGELRRVDLASKLLAHPDVLLLDEPTNHIDTRSVEWIEGFLETYTGSCVLVTHDRYFLDRVVNRIVEIEFQKVYSFPGSYEKFLEYKSGVEESQSRTEDNRLALLRRELAWFRRGAKARSTKQKARIHRLVDVQEEGPPQRHREFVFEIPEPGSLGKTILEARELTLRLGERFLFRNFSLIMQKEMRVGILGPNGSGKTTLLRVLMGLQEQTKGKVITGDNTAFLYVDQAHADVKPNETVLDFVSEGAKYVEVNKRRIYIPAYLEKFLFDKSSVLVPVSTLSGGERNRLDMVKKLLRGGNFLVLDEPTNDLDLYTLRVLEETIDAFAGCALIVSHDRYFLNRVCTHLLIFEDDGRITQITGNYDDYLLYMERQAQARQQEGKQSAQAQVLLPKQEKARRLSYKEKQELDGMEGSILALEEAVARLEGVIGDPSFYQQEHTRVQATLAELQEARKAVEVAYARWAELEEIAK